MNEHTLHLSDGDSFALHIRQCEIELVKLLDKMFIESLATDEKVEARSRVAELEEEIKYFEYLEAQDETLYPNGIEKYI